MTIGDRIRSSSDRELAERIKKLINCSACMKYFDNQIEKFPCYYGTFCVNGWEAYLGKEEPTR